MAKTNEVKNETTVVEAPKPSYDALARLTVLKSKSAVIREMSANGMKAAEIHKLLKTHKVFNSGKPGFEDTAIRYQHVRNVLNTPVSKKS